MNHNIATLSFIPATKDQDFTLIVSISNGGQLTMQGEHVLGLYFHFVDILAPDDDHEGGPVH